MDLKKNKKEVVLNRLKQTAAKIWDYRESETEGFDPVIDLLFGACASEFEKLSTELYISQTRILEKIAQILLPEINLRPHPSYAILQAKPVNIERQADQTDQFVFEKEFTGNSSGKIEQRKIFFSPTSGFRLIDAEIVLMATSKEVVRINDFLRETLVRSATHQIPHKNTLWLGVKINPSIKTLKNISFYFNWYNNPDKTFLLNLVPMAEWSINGKKIRTKMGFSHDVEEKYKAVSIDITNFLDINLKTEKKINLFFEDSFITISDDILPVKIKYPNEFTEYFKVDDLDNLKEEINWIEVEFPDMFPPELLISTFCTINAFPVMNRRLHDSSRPYTLNDDLNIFPILSEDLFFTIRNIISSNHINYQEVPFKKASDFAPGTYTIRTKGVKRFDERDAYEYVEYLMELLREEYVAFKSIGGSLVEKELNDLLVIINRLRLNVLKSNDVKVNTHFIIMKSEIVEDIWLEFWSTTGTFGNNIPMGIPCVHNDFDKKSLRLLTSTSGGKNPPDQLERTYLFKNELLTRDRLVTREDIKVFCQAELGGELEDVSVAQGVIMGQNRYTGLQNCLLVKLAFKNEKSVIEKENIVNHIEKSLRQKSSCIYSYKIECID
jgi:hypothetical protein